MKRFVHANTSTEKHLSGCSFDFDLGTNYNPNYLERAIEDALSDLPIEILGFDFRSVEYPGDKIYSQCGFDFEWHGAGSDYTSAKILTSEIEEALEDLIDDEGGNFFGIDVYSLED